MLTEYEGDSGKEETRQANSRLSGHGDLEFAGIQAASRTSWRGRGA